MTSFYLRHAYLALSGGKSTSRLYDNKITCYSYIICEYSSYFVTGANVWKLIKIVPKVMAQWENLAFCMTYKTEEFNALRNAVKNFARICSLLAMILHPKLIKPH